MPCPVCEWDGDVARTHDSTHRYYTHVAEVDDELLRGRTCSERTRPRRGLLERLRRAIA
jgi:hypothetical protein